MHAGALHAGKFTDSARQFALKRAGIVDFLHKVRLAHLDLVKNFKADALPHQTAFAGNLDALVVDHFPGHHDGGPVVSQLIRDFVGLQSLDHMTGVFRTQIGIEHAVFRSAQPYGKTDDDGQQSHRAAGHGHALDHAHFAPESSDDVHKIRQESWHDISPGLSCRQQAGCCILLAIAMPFYNTLKYNTIYFNTILLATCVQICDAA